VRWVAAIGVMMLVACGLPKNGLGPEQDEGGPGLDACCADAPPGADAPDATPDDSTADVVPQDAPGDEGADSGDGSTGHAGYALQFGGGAFLQMGPVPIPTDFTLEAWVFPTSIPTTGDACIVANELQGDNTYQFRLGLDIGGPLFFMMSDAAGDNGGLITPGGSYVLVTPAPLATNVWTHVAVTKAGTSFMLYAGAATPVQFTANGALDYGNPLVRAFRVGGRVANDGIGGPDCSFTGTVDEVRLWSAQRSASQIAQTMSHTVSAGDPTLFAYWRFDDGTGTTAIDEEGHYPGGFPVGFPDPLWVPSSAF
jgi:hypothetical protein